MGIVYLARQEKPIRRRVAVKVIKLGMDTKEVIARFELERQTLAMMNHPNIAKVFEAGATEDGRPYFVMENVSGLPITEYCNQERLSNPERLQLYVVVCEAIQHAHQKGVVHRDIKPTNILVELGDSKPVPKVIDFGIAKAISQRLTEKSVFTQHGVLIGTPAYMSPEQAEMSTLDIDTRSDVYSLGVLLYELLVGALPFDLVTLQRAGWDGMRHIIREMVPQRPSNRVSTIGDKATEFAKCRGTDFTSLRRQLRGDLDWIPMKAMEKNRTRRYATALELAADVERHLKHEPVVAGPPSTMYWVGKFVRRHRVGVFAASLVLMAMLLGIAGTTTGLIRATRAEAQARQEAETAQQVSDFLVGLFEVSHPNEAKGNTITAREILDKGAKEITEGLKDQPLIQARLMNTIGNIYVGLGLYEEAAPHLEKALTIRQDSKDADHTDVAESLHNLAFLYRNQGKYLEAEPLYQRALATREKDRGPDHTDVASSLDNLASLYRIQGKYAEAEPLFQRALAIREKVFGPDHPNVATSLNNLALFYYDQQEHSEAEPLYQRALAIHEKVFGPDHPYVAISLNNLASLSRDQEKYLEAEPLFQRALAIHEKALGVDHPHVGRSLGNLALLYYDQGKYADAEPLYQRALAISEKALGPDHVDVAISLNHLADLSRDQGKYAEAEPLYQRALAISEKALGPDHPRVAHTLIAYAALLRKLDRAGDATEMEARVESIRTKYGKQNPEK